MALLMIFIVYELRLYWRILPKSLTILLSMQQYRFQVSKYKLKIYQNWGSKWLQEIVKISCQFEDNFSMRKRRCTVFTLKRGNQFGLYLRERQDMLCFVINNIWNCIWSYSSVLNSLVYYYWSVPGKSWTVHLTWVSDGLQGKPNTWIFSQ